MTQFETVTLYIGLHILLMMVLKMRVGATRGRVKVQFGDGGNETLIRAQRVQGNAVEDVPIILLGLLALAAMNAPVPFLHVLGATLFLSRVMHAIGLGKTSEFSLGRVAGSLGTVFVMLLTGGACIWFGMARIFGGG